MKRKIFSMRRGSLDIVTIILGVILFCYGVFSIVDDAYTTVEKKQTKDGIFTVYTYSLNSGDNSICVLQDNETGCQYLGGAGGTLILVINADGSPYLVKSSENYKHRFEVVDTGSRAYIVDNETGCYYITSNLYTPICVRVDEDGSIYHEEVK